MSATSKAATRSEEFPYHQRGTDERIRKSDRMIVMAALTDIVWDF
jgi:hypothetical protein